jgi:hypothetical protein
VSRAELSRELRARWRDILAAAARAGLRPSLVRRASLPAGPVRLLGSSAKVRKGLSDFLVRISVLYMLPGLSSGVDLCPRATRACRALCLGLKSGHLAMTKGTARRAQIWRTALWLGDPDGFRALLDLDLQALARRAADDGVEPWARLDGSSDLGLAWDGSISEDYGVAFYDYSKHPGRAMAHPERVALSYTGSNAAECAALLRAGGRVSAVLPVRPRAPKPASIRIAGRSWPAVDGDAHDFVPADPPGSVRLLGFKAPSNAGFQRGIRQGIRDGWVLDHEIS